MSYKSTIEWTDSTWNPVTGCTKVSPGCKHCYAERFSERFRGAKGHYFESGFDLELRPHKLRDPYKWKEPRRIFVNSMSDLFHEKIPRSYIDQIFKVMEDNPRHTFQVLTKRADRMRRYVSRYAPHIHLGISVENKATLWRIDHLINTVASTRFISFEPLLGPIGKISLRWVDWIIVGGESGPSARPMDPDWARELRDTAGRYNVPFFFKQWGGRTPKSNGNLLDGRQHLEQPC